MTDQTKRAVFLDRDGVLNRTYIHEDGKSHPPASPEELEVLPGVSDACKALRAAGFLLIVVTNQPDVARGTQSRTIVEAINEKLRSHVPVDEILVCYHDSSDNCGCRKPNPGLILEAARTWGIDLQESFIVGDRWSDIEACRRVGCKAIMIDGIPRETKQCRPDFQASSLSEAVGWILHGQQKTSRVS